MNFLRLGVLVPTETFEETCSAFFGTWTFEEAYARTRRPVTIVISSNFSQKLPACVMLNHMTAPRVTIASAVATSCAAVGVMSPRGLVIKDPATGELRPFDVLGKSFADGTFTAEVPKDYLRSMFGVTQFLVSQVNPHRWFLVSQVGNMDSAVQTLRGYFGHDLQRRARLLSEQQLLPSFFGRTMCKATKHLSQDFGESQDGITVVPPAGGLRCFHMAVSNPSTRDMERYILEGQQMVWSSSREIYARMHMEVALAKAVASIDGPQGRPAHCCLEQPPWQPPAPTASPK